MIDLLVSMLCLASGLGGIGIVGIGYYAWKDDALGVLFFCGLTHSSAIFFVAALISLGIRI
jgi:hypothetical protein